LSIIFPSCCKKKQEDAQKNEAEFAEEGKKKG
jgi:hypothetical protein